MIEIARRQFRELRGETRSRTGRHRPWRNIGQRHDLVIYGLRHLLAPVTDVDTPHTRRRIEQALALAVLDVDTVAMTQQRAPMITELDDVVPGMNEQIVLLLEFHRRIHDDPPVLVRIELNVRGIIFISFNFAMYFNDIAILID